MASTGSKPFIFIFPFKWIVRNAAAELTFIWRFSMIGVKTGQDFNILELCGNALILIISNSPVFNPSQCFGRPLSRQCGMPIHSARVLQNFDEGGDKAQGDSHYHAPGVGIDKPFDPVPKPPPTMGAVGKFEPKDTILSWSSFD
jgi:hypothetical protein